MTQNYVNGFFTKCAEYRIPYDAACHLCKIAIDDEFRNSQREMARNFAVNNKYLGDISKYLPEEGFADGNRMGTLIGRTFGSLFRSGKSRERNERAQYVEALRGAGKKWLKAQMATARTPEERMAIQKRFEEFAGHLDAGLAANEHGNGLSNAARDLAAYGGTKTPDAKPEAGSVLTPSKPKNRYDQLMRGELALPSFYRHAFDANTGEFYRTDGRTLDPQAELWNKRMQLSRQEYADWQKNNPEQVAAKPAAPAQKPWDAPYKAPEAGKPFGT